MPQNPFFVLLADDHAIVRLGLKVIIGNIDKNVHVEEANNADSVVAKLKSRSFDLLILDINMRNAESFSLVNYIRREFPSLQVLIFTVNNELVFATRFLRSGVSGYLLKQSAESEIVAAFNAVREGRLYISDSLSRMITGRMVSDEARTPFESLTDREFEVVLQLLKGNSAEEIAGILHLNKSTVGTHKSRIMKKLKVESTVDLLELAKQYRIM